MQIWITAKDQINAHLLADSSKAYNKHKALSGVQWRSKGGAADPGRHFADEKLISERILKVLAFRYYFKYIFKCSNAF